MKTDSKPLIAVCGVLTIGIFGFTLVQVLPVFKGNTATNFSASANKGKAALVVMPVSQAIPVVTSDPFRVLDAPVIGSAVPAPGPQTSAAQSAPVVSNPPVQGEIGANNEQLPQVDMNSNSNQPNGESQEAPNLTIGFRGVIVAAQTKAYLAVHGKAARPYALGATVIEGVVLFNIQDSFIELKSGEEIIRLRVGQEVQL